MRRTVYGILGGLTLALLGCGKGDAPKSGPELNEAQNKAQQQADDDERQRIKDNRKKK
jgi:hypothetical protein